METTNPSAFSTEPFAGPRTGYLICCQERTGSTLLVKTLRSTNLAGTPIEYFNPVMQQNQLRNIFEGISLPESFPRVLKSGTTPNGVFGAKLHWPHLRFLGLTLAGEWSESKRLTMLYLLRAQLPRLLSLSDAVALLDAQFSDLRPQLDAIDFLRSHLPGMKVIWLRRKNMVARAISHYRALSSGVWMAEPGEAPSGKPTEIQPQFDLGEIHTMYCLAHYQLLKWPEIFRQAGIEPYAIDYEDLIGNYRQTIRGVLEFLDLDADQVRIPPPLTGRQADTLSLEWEQRYREAVPVEDER